MPPPSLKTLLAPETPARGESLFGMGMSPPGEPPAPAVRRKRPRDPFQALFLARLRDVSRTLARLKALYPHNFWAVHAALVSDQRIGRAVDRLSSEMNRLAAMPERLAAQERWIKRLVASAQLNKARRDAALIAAVRRAEPATPRALPQPEEQKADSLELEAHARSSAGSVCWTPDSSFEEDDADAAQAHEEATEEERASAALLAEAFAALDAAEAEHARVEAELAAAAAEVERSRAEKQHQLAAVAKSQASAASGSAEKQPPRIPAFTLAASSSPSDAKAATTRPERPQDQEQTERRQPTTPTASAEPPAPRGLSKGLLAKMQALEAAAGVEVDVGTYRSPRAVRS